jgi:hypothetical protein
MSLEMGLVLQQAKQPQPQQGITALKYLVKRSRSTVTAAFGGTVSPEAGTLVIPAAVLDIIAAAGIMFIVMKVRLVKRKMLKSTQALSHRQMMMLR